MQPGEVSALNFNKMGDRETELRVVLVGKTGSGKSSTGNTILRRNAFQVDLSATSVTRTCEKHEGGVEGRNISVIDTPGLFDTMMTVEELKTEVMKCVEMSVPGPHAFLLVIRLGAKFTEKEKNGVKWIQKYFGEEASRFTIIVFTHGDELSETLEQYISRSRDIRQLVLDCEDRFVLFKNMDMQNLSQVSELMTKIRDLGNGHYTNEMYRRCTKRIRREEEERRRRIEDQIRQEERMKREEEERRRRIEEQIREEERRRFNRPGLGNVLNTIEECVQVVRGFTAGIANGGVAATAAAVVGVTAGVSILATVAAPQLVALTTITGAGIVWHVVSKRMKRRGRI